MGVISSPPSFALVSPGQSFELGFFSPGNSKIRNIPITSSNGFLALTTNGLLLSNHTNSVIWSSNTTKVAESPIAQLLDSGNFVVKDNAMVSSDSSESYLWQSFDYPSNIWLPGMRITNDFNTGLTSWKSLDDPSLGDYAYRNENPELPQQLMYHMDEYEHMHQPESPLVNRRITLNTPVMGSVEQIASAELRTNRFTMSTKGCEKECLKNCSCTGYTNSNITGKGHGHLMWFSGI
ncbi:S-locus-specific glycoprotein S6-like [Durio zibethinus]|uniref:S-locus-specific glycoprotein S6-like n=1 Tax=Durio zibethinus TaxID=66656 RepID=A0A6P5ZM65_DURZI|nr:S-locus-specific glycoprotein S6-like [Durio zibethinus]